MVQRPAAWGAGCRQELKHWAAASNQCSRRRGHGQQPSSHSNMLRGKQFNKTFQVSCPIVQSCPPLCPIVQSCPPLRQAKHWGPQVSSWAQLMASNLLVMLERTLLAPTTDIASSANETGWLSPYSSNPTRLIQPPTNRAV